MKKLALAWLLILISLASAGSCLATPSSGFYKSDGEEYDDWNLARTRCWDEDGFFQVTETDFRPAIVFESLGDLKGKAWEIGERLAEQYSGNELAEQIFSYARDHVTYTSDATQFGSDEFARNADEVAEEIESQGASRGDCEDYAVLLAVMFRAAGFRSAVVLAPEHAAALVHLPDPSGGPPPSSIVPTSSRTRSWRRTSSQLESPRRRTRAMGAVGCFSGGRLSYR